MLPLPMKTVLTIAPEPLIRLGLRHMLGTEARFTICGEACNHSDAVQMSKRLRPELAVLAVPYSGDTIALIKDLLRARSALPILVVSRAPDTQSVQRAFRAGARGYVTSLDDTSELLLAVATVRHGSLYASRTAYDGLLMHLTARPGTESKDDLSRLSDREMEIFQLIGEGMGCKDIANRLHISVKTVETHRQRMKEKLCVPTGSELNRRAASHALSATLRKGSAKQEQK